MGMGFRLSRAVVVAAALFAVAWAVCDQLAALGVGASSAAAGVLAIVAFGLTLRVPGLKRPRVRHPGTVGAEPIGLQWRVETRPRGVTAEPAARSDEPERELPEKPGITEDHRRTPRTYSHDTGSQTLVTRHNQFIVDDAGMQVRRKRKTVGGEIWEEYLRIEWSAVKSIGFATGRHDPIIALYLRAAAGKPRHAADSQFLSHLQWTELGQSDC